MPTIDATVGGADANSFATHIEAEAYFDDRLHADAWNDAEEDDQLRALIQATRLLNALVGRNSEWTGAAASETQRLAWPRTGMTSSTGYAVASDEIPEEITAAEFEIALSLLQATSDPLATSAIESLGLTSLKAGPVALTFKDELQVSANLIPDVAFDLLVPSWYEEIEDDNFLFEVM
jgi:hypothetical protein